MNLKFVLAYINRVTDIAQLVACPTHKKEIVGSNPGTF